jgi:hypothetical protein
MSKVTLFLLAVALAGCASTREESTAATQPESPQHLPDFFRANYPPGVQTVTSRGFSCQLGGTASGVAPADLSLCERGQRPPAH